ncbi:alkaline shock response membrane anchor protein AmaP [Actinomadura darangshiensis]|uniref:Alkaline shock response membrane anchor protein AmaP n=1 Tax=Actinomadura darangshiensis TaxID=705336 RepID=A0A4R5A287_9ACTN|nr:DUF6286 domain-containing protein [Actinomadura darangshiensis]TDD64916.1 alkaline shock response membrane anchor protein AmaP [Actinomadura darangshiensis]
MAETLVKDLIEEAQGRQQARRLAVREFRPRRASAGFAAALLLTASGGVAAIELLAAALGSAVHPVPGVAPVVDVLRGYAWADPDVLVVAGGVAALGTAFLLAALPGRLRGIPLAGDDPRLAGVIGRAALRRALADAALDVPGIERARVRGLGVLRRGLVVRATTCYRNPANSAELVQRAIGARLDRIEPMHRPAVDVRLGWRKD